MTGKEIARLRHMADKEVARLHGQIDDAVAELAKLNTLYSQCLKGNQILRAKLAAFEPPGELDTAMAELCARLREHFEASGHPTCPDPECDYAAYENTEHVPDCAYAKYAKAQDAAIVAVCCKSVADKKEDATKASVNS